MTPPARRAALAAAVLALALGLAACGEKSEDVVSAEAQPFDLALDFYVNPDHAGIYTAIEQGFFERAGLAVAPRVPSDPSAPIKEVAAGRADLAISYEPEVLLAREQGLDVIAVAALVDEPLTSLITLPESGVAEPADLQGKTVATAGIPYQSDYLATILSEAGVQSDSVEEVSVGFNLLPAILGGQADAILGGFRNVEGVDLTLRGENPTRHARGRARGADLRRAGAGGARVRGRGARRGAAPLHRRPAEGDRRRRRRPRRGEQA